jgi:ApbE superfamily uncharacterized protein (UPF0280 family)
MSDQIKHTRADGKIPIKEHFQLKETIVTMAADNQYRSRKKINYNPPGSS